MEDANCVGLLGCLLLLPLVLSNELKYSDVMSAMCGSALIGFAFTMRVVAFTSAASGAVDRWIILRLLKLEKHVGFTPPPTTTNNSES